MSEVIYNLKTSLKNPSSWELGTLWLDIDRAYDTGIGFTVICIFSTLKVHAEHHEVDRAPGGRAQFSRVLLLPRGQDAAHNTHHAQPHDLQVVLIRECRMHFLSLSTI